MKDMIESLVTRLRDLVDDDSTPEPNCSCHISPPCHDCTENAHRRELIEAAKRTLAQADEELPLIHELVIYPDGVNPDGSAVGRAFKATGYVEDLVAIRQRCELSFAPTTLDLARWFDAWWDDDTRYKPYPKSAKEMCWEAVKAMSVDMPHPVTGEVDVVRINERVAASFWAQLGFGSTVDEAAVKCELTDYHFLLKQVPRVYQAVTGGLLSKTSHYAETIINAFDDHVDVLVTKRVQEDVPAGMIEILRMTLSRADEGVPDEATIQAASEALGDAYDCNRVWEAWSYGTMGPDDFSLVREDGDRVAEIIKAIVKSWLTSTIKTLKENQDEQG